MRLALLLSVAAVVCVAYSLYEPLPEFVQDRMLVGTLLAVIKIFNCAGGMAEKLGINWKESFGRNTFSLLLPTPSNSSSVQFAYQQFGSSRTVVAAAADVSKRSGAGVVFLHGGGWSLGAPEMFLEVAEELVNRTGATVFLVRYRLAPEHKFPAAFDDCMAAVESIFASAADAGIDSSRILIGGESAGGQLAASVVQQLRAQGSRHRPKLQLLLYPITQVVNRRTQSHVDRADGLLAKSQGLGRAVSMYLLGNDSAEQLLLSHGHVTPKVQAAYASAVAAEIPATASADAERQMTPQLESLLLDFRVSPLLNSRIEELQLPPTFVVGCEFDPLRDDAEMYASRLRRAGVQVQFKMYRTFHGATAMPNDGKEIRDDVVSFINSSL